MASLSVDELGGGKFKLRWRELVAGEDGRPQRGTDGRLVSRSRSLTVEGKDARDEAVARIRRALLEEGEYQAPTAAPEAPATNLETAALAWLKWKGTRCARGSVKRYAGEMARLFAAVRQIKGIAKTAPVPAAVMSRDLLVSCVSAWQEEGLSESYVYGAARSALEMWRWVADDPESYPAVPNPPREGKAVLPRPPIYVVPPAPTLAETDACLRHLSAASEQTRRLGVVMRYTGLRADQVLQVRRRDVDLVNATLVVTTGKSRAEKAEQRTIPLSRHLVAELRAWVDAYQPEHLLFPAWGVVGSDRKAGIKPDLFRVAWKEATKWGEAREIAWKPANRETARPEHAFRAAFQAALRVAKVSEPVIDALVGHHGKTTRGRHYAGHDTLWDQMVEAVATLSPIDHVGPQDRGTVIALTKRRKAEAVRSAG